MGLITLPPQLAHDNTQQFADRARLWCLQLEAGNILLFPQTPVTLAQEDLQFLLSLKQSNHSLHKNLAYKAAQDRIAGAPLQSSAPEARERLRCILRSYSQQVTQCLTEFLLPYETRWQVDYASFRPLEEQGRALPLRKRNDRLHIDAFPTRPTRGARILRFFSNLHPTQPREWIVGEPFRALLPQFAPAHLALPKAENALARLARKSVQRAGLGRVIPALLRSPYDRFMLRFHDFLKENSAYQAQGKREALSFPPGSSWLVYTDTVPHAVLSGQFALEQTFLVAPQAMVSPEDAPLSVLESLTRQQLV
ncbi:MAG TPA: Kdo hydroxylase family protein [Acidobacteriaceae bacterium]|nr:Kdo hydroxylase family protein [Acidobacteriaceae bacterium]